MVDSVKAGLVKARLRIGYIGQAAASLIRHIDDSSAELIWQLPNPGASTTRDSYDLSQYGLTDELLQTTDCILVDGVLIDHAAIARLRSLCAQAVFTVWCRKLMSDEQQLQALRKGYAAVFEAMDQQTWTTLVRLCERSDSSVISPYWHYDGKSRLECRGASCYATLFRFRQAVEHLPLPHFSPDDRADINLIVEELGRNAIEWGNNNDSRKSIVLALRWSESWLVFQVGDQGTGFQPDEVPDPRIDPIAHIDQRKQANKRPGGYGIHLVREMTDGMWWSPQGNGVVIVRKLGSRADTMTSDSLRPAVLLDQLHGLWGEERRREEA